MRAWLCLLRLYKRLSGGGSAGLLPALPAGCFAVFELLMCECTLYRCAHPQGKPTGTDDQALAAAEGLLAQGARAVLVTLEARGAMLVSGSRAAGTLR